jgi:hypothetical protein
MRETVDFPDPIPPVRPTVIIGGRPYHAIIDLDPLHASRPDRRLRAAQALREKDRRAVLRRAEGWPNHSPGAVNAWLLLFTRKPPSWEDPLLPWTDASPTLGEPHPGFFYPDPTGFWAEVRHWVHELVRVREPGWSLADALSVAALVHRGDDAERLSWMRALARPRVILFLDEPSWSTSGLTARQVAHRIKDPFRPQVYEGFWGRTPDGIIVGKAPQHPSMHNLYDTSDMTGFLRSAPAGDEDIG